MNEMRRSNGNKRDNGAIGKGTESTPRSERDVQEAPRPYSASPRACDGYDANRGLAVIGHSDAPIYYKERRRGIWKC